MVFTARHLFANEGLKDPFLGWPKKPRAQGCYYRCSTAQWAAFGEKRPTIGLCNFVWYLCVCLNQHIWRWIFKQTHKYPEKELSAEKSLFSKLEISNWRMSNIKMQINRGIGPNRINFRPYFIKKTYFGWCAVVLSHASSARASFSPQIAREGVVSRKILVFGSCACAAVQVFLLYVRVVTPSLSLVVWYQKGYSQKGVSSVPFPFWFPFQLHWKLVSSGISSQSVQNILIWRVT